MIFNLNGNRATIGYKQLQYSGGVLVFDVSGDTFPKSNYTSGTNFNNTKFEFICSGSNKMTVNYGDGNVVTYDTKSNVFRFNPSIPSGNSTNHPIHTYTDSNIGRRFIQISFSEPEKVIQLNTVYVNMYGEFPDNIDKTNKLTTISINQSNLISFPVSISNLTSLTSLTLTSIGTAISQRIPNEFLNLNLTVFRIAASIDLSDNATSNFINFLNSNNKLTLQSLSIDSCNLSGLPNEMSNLTRLNTLICGSTNIFSTMPTIINSIPSLTFLNIGASNNVNSSITQWSSFSNLINLVTNSISVSPNMTTNLPPDLVNCTKLKTYTANGTYTTTARVNTFIDNMYSFVTTNAEITGANTLPFRGMAINCSSASVTGTYQQPSGYVTGTSNGTPASQKEKIWVLVNQYGHTVTYTA